MENRTEMDTMLVSRVRILYIRSLLSRAPELQSLKVPPVERFFKKAGSGSGRGSRNSSLGSSPQRSPRSRDADDYGHGFRINLRQEKRSKFSSLVSKLMGNDQENPSTFFEFVVQIKDGRKLPLKQSLLQEPLPVAVFSVMAKSRCWRLLSLNWRAGLTNTSFKLCTKGLASCVAGLTKVCLNMLMEVACGPHGAVKGLSADKVYVDVSTVDDETAKAIYRVVQTTGAEFLRHLCWVPRSRLWMVLSFFLLLLPRRCIQVLDKGMCQAQLLQLDDEENHKELAAKRVVKRAEKAGSLSKVRGGRKFPSVRVLWKHSRQPQMHEVRFS